MSAVASLGVIVGSLSPWVDVGPRSLDGVGGVLGIPVLLLGLLALALHGAGLIRPRRGLWTLRLLVGSLVLGAAISAWALVEWVGRSSDLVAPALGVDEQLDTLAAATAVSPGWGLWLTGLSGLSLVAASFAGRVADARGHDRIEATDALEEMVYERPVDWA